MISIQPENWLHKNKVQIMGKDEINEGRLTNELVIMSFSKSYQDICKVYIFSLMKIFPSKTNDHAIMRYHKYTIWEYQSIVLRI